jgi:hypothetical protein
VAASDVVQETREEITRRLEQLRPTVEEYRRLEAAVTALAGIPTATSPGRGDGGRPQRSSGQTVAPLASPKSEASKPARRSAKTKRRGGRRKGSGVRAAQARLVIQESPGLAIPEIAERMKVNPSYLYRVLPGLEREKKVRRKGRGWYPVGTA